MDQDIAKVREAMVRQLDGLEPSAPIQRIQNQARRSRLLRATSIVAAVGVAGTSAILLLSGASGTEVNRGARPGPVTPAEVDESGARADGSAAPEERAATVALAALTAAKLEGSSGSYFDYGGVTSSEEEWTAHFCSERQSLCDTDDSDGQLEVALDGADMVVIAATGSLEAHAGDLEGYREPAAAPTPTDVYADFTETEQIEDSIGIETTHYWTGAIPSNLQAACKAQAVDDEGRVVYETLEFRNSAPTSEGARDGAFSAGVPERKATGNYRVECTPFEPKTSESRRGPKGPGRVVAESSSPGPRGTTWEVRAWDEPDGWCWRFGSKGDTENHETTCTPRAGWPLGAMPGGFVTPSESGEPGYASGQVRNDVASVELRFDSGTTVVADMVDAPPDMDIPSRYYVAFIEDPEATSGERVALDAEGNVIASRRFGSGSG